MRQVVVSRRAAIAALVVPALVLVAFAARSYQPFTGEAGGRAADLDDLLRWRHDGHGRPWRSCGAGRGLGLPPRFEGATTGTRQSGPVCLFRCRLPGDHRDCGSGLHGHSERRLVWEAGGRRGFAVSRAGGSGAACAPTGARSRSADHLAAVERARRSDRSRDRSRDHHRASPRPSRAPHASSSWRSSAGRSTRRSTISAVIPIRGVR